jgi:hypothetical protein
VAPWTCHQVSPPVTGTSAKATGRSGDLWPVLAFGELATSLLKAFREWDADSALLALVRRQRWLEDDVADETVLLGERPASSRRFVRRCGGWRRGCP